MRVVSCKLLLLVFDKSIKGIKIHCPSVVHYYIFESDSESRVRSDDVSGPEQERADDPLANSFDRVKHERPDSISSV